MSKCAGEPLRALRQLATAQSSKPDVSGAHLLGQALKVGLPNVSYDPLLSRRSSRF